MDISLLNKKKPLLNSITLKENEIEFSKDINSDKITCSKLICDDIEINNSGETNIDNAAITNSKINNTVIGVLYPSRGIFNRFQLKTSGSLDTSFIIDSDISISNLKFMSQERTINSINPLKMFSNQYLSFDTNQYLLVNSSGYINISSRADINLSTPKNIVFNSNNFDIQSPSFNIYGQTIFNNISDSSDFISSSIISKGGIAIYKNLNIQGHIISNNSIDSTNINNGSLILKGGASIQKNIIIGKDINIFGKSFIHNYTNSSDLYTGSSINYGGSVIKKNCYIGGNVNFIDKHDSNAFNIFSKSYFNNTVRINSDIIIHGPANFNNLTIQNNLNNPGTSNIYNLNIDNNLIINSNHNSFITHGSISTFKNFNIQGKIISNNSNHDALTLQGGAIINKNLIVHKNLTIFSNSNNSLNLYGDALFYNNLNIQNSLTIDKNINVKNNTILNNTIINGKTNINNSLFITNNLNVSKNTIIQNNLQVSNNITTNNISINNNLRVVNNINSNNLLIHKNITVNNDLLILGNSNLYNNTNTDNLISKNHSSININTTNLYSSNISSDNINSNIFVSNYSNINTLQSTNIYSNTIKTYNLNISNNLNINNTIKLLKNDGIALDVNSDALIRGSLQIHGNFSISGKSNFIATDNTTIKDNIICLNKGVINNVYDSGIIIDRGLSGNNAVFAWNELNKQFILGTTTNDDTDLYIQYQKSTLNSNILSDTINTQKLNVLSDSNFYNNLNIFSNTKLYSPFTSYDSVYFNKNLYISNNSTIGVYINSNTSFQGTSIFYNNSHFHNSTTFHKNSLLNVFSNSNFYGNINITNTNTNIYSNTTFHNQTYLKDTLHINNNNNNNNNNNGFGLIVDSNTKLNKSLYLYDKSYFLNDLIIGNNSNNTIIFNSKISDFKMIEGLSFQNNSNNLYLSNINTIFFNSNTNTLHSSIINKDLIVKNQSIFYNNVIIGYNNTSLVTFNSKLSDFKMHNGAQFNNTSTDLIISHNNIFIDSNVSTNKLNVKDELNVLQKSNFYNNINIISNNSNLSSSIIFNNKSFIENNHNFLHIKHNNVYINSNLNTNSLQIKNNLHVYKKTFLLNDIICGHNSNNIITFNSKLSDFNMSNNASFTNNNTSLTISNNNTTLTISNNNANINSLLITKDLDINNNLNVYNNSYFKKNIVLGESKSNLITINSKMSDFTLHNGTQFINKNNQLDINETNIFLNTNLTTNNFIAQNNSIFYGNIDIGTNSSNIVNFKAKLSNFNLQHGALFTNSSQQLTIKETNTFLDTYLSTNDLTINNHLIVNKNTIIKGDLTIGDINSSNIITFNSKLNDFTLHQGALFTNSSQQLTIKETNTFLDTYLSTNDLTINNHLIVNKNTTVKGNLIIGDINSSNNIIFNSKLSDFTMHNNAQFIDDINNLTIQKQLTTFDGNVLLNYLTIKDNLLVQNQSTFYGNVYFGTNNTNNIFFNSKLSDFTMHNGAKFNNIDTNTLKITQNNIILNSTTTTTTNIIVNQNSSFVGNVSFGIPNTLSNITLNSALSDFTLHKGAIFQNTHEQLSITEKNTYLNTTLTTNNLIVKNDLLLQGNVSFGGIDSTNYITFNSKLNDFTLHNGTSFTNTTDTLIIDETNILLNSNLSTNNLNIYNNLNVEENSIFKGDVTFGLTPYNITTFNSKLSDFTLHAGAVFTNTFEQLTIVEKNILLDGTLTTNNLIVKNDFSLQGTVSFGEIGSTNYITFNSRLNDFILSNGASFSNTTDLLTITETNILLNTNLTTNHLTINKDLLVKEDVQFNKNLIIGTNNTNTITFNSKLQDFTLHNGTVFTNTIDNLTITETNILLDTNLTTNYLTINNDLLVNEDVEFKNNLIIGTDNTNIITFNSKLKDFTLHNGSTFINTTDLLTITETNTLLDTNLTTNYLTINNDLLVEEDVQFKKNLIIGTNDTNTITFNSKLQDFTLHNGTIFTNTIDNLTITETNILLDTYLTTNYLTINNDLLVNEDVEFKKNLIIGTDNTNTITFNSKLEDFTLHNGSTFINTTDLLTITETNMLLDTNLTTNYLTINNDLLVSEDVQFNKNLIIGTDNTNTITFNSKLSDFTLHNGTTFTNSTGLLTIMETNTLLDTNLTTNYLTINNDLLVSEDVELKKNLIIGTNNTNTVTFNSKLSDFTLHNGTTFSNTTGLLTITETNMLLDTNLTTNYLTTNYLTVNNDLLVEEDVEFKKNLIIGTDNTNNITFNSKLSDFTLHNGTLFSNTTGLLTITETNTLLDTYLTTNYLTINNDLLVKEDVQFKKNLIIGTNNTNTITFNSTLSDFILHNGSTFTNTSGQLTITETNMLLDTNLTTNYLTINNDLLVSEDVEFKKNLIIGTNNTNTITFNSKLSDFTLHNGTVFTNTTGLLTITETNTLLDTNLTTNYLTINNDLLVKKDVQFKKNLIIGTDNTNTITFNSKLEDFTLHNGSTFTNTSGQLTITETNILLDTNLTTNYLTINNDLLVSEDVEFKKNLIIGTNNTNTITFNSKLSNFTLHNGTVFTNTIDNLTITETNTLLDTNLTTNYLTINNDLLVKEDVSFNKNLIIGTNNTNTITFNSKLSDFTLHNGSTFINTSGLLTITETNTLLDTNLTTNYLTINNDLLVSEDVEFKKNLIIGTNNTNTITFNSKLSDFTLHNGTTFSNTTGLLTITETNILLDTNLTTNYLTINNDLLVKEDVEFKKNLIIGTDNTNTITFNSKLSDFTLHNGTLFTNTIGLLIIKETNTLLDTNLTTNNLTINNDLLVKEDVEFKKNLIIGTNNTNTITFNSKLSDFTLHNGTVFTNTAGLLTITETNMLLDTNLTTKQITVNNLSTFNNNIICGTNKSNLVTFNSKISDFHMHSGAEFTDTVNTLTIKKINTILDTNLTTNNLTITNGLTVNNLSTFNSDMILGTNKSNIITINSKLSDFELLYGATISNKSDNILHFKETNILLDGDTTINSNLNILNNTTINSSLNVTNSILAKNIIISEDLLVHGDLLINGKTTIIDTENMSILDNIIELNSGATTNVNDTGILINRGQTYQNAFIGWKEQTQKFIVGTTIQNSSTTGSIDITVGSLLANVEGNINAHKLHVSEDTILNNTLLVKKNATFKSNITLGTTINDNIILHSKLSDFSMHNGAQFINTPNYLTIDENNTIFNGDIIAQNSIINNDLQVDKNTTLNGDIVLGTNNANNIITVNSKISNFSMFYNASFSNTSDNLIISEKNTYLNTQLTTDSIYINNNINIDENIIVHGNTTLGSNYNNITKIKSKLDNFTMHNNASFINSPDLLTIESKNINLDTNLNISKNTFIAGNTILGSNHSNITNIHSKLSNFTMHNNASFINTTELLTIKSKNIAFDGNLNIQNATINNTENFIIKGDTDIGTTLNNKLNIFSKISDFTMHNNTQFINTPNLLTINSQYINLNGVITLDQANINNNIIINKNATINGNTTIGADFNNHIIFNSKLSDFTLHKGAQFTNIDNNLTITETNTYLNTNLTTDKITIYNLATFNDNIICGTDNSNTITFNSKLSDFTLHNGTLFTNTTGLLTITETNTLLDTYLTTNYLTINNDLLVNEDVEFKKNLIIGTNNTNTITFNSKLKDFTLHNGSTFTNTFGQLTITETNMLLDTNLSTNYLTINNDLLVSEDVEFKKNLIIGTDNSNTITFNSKLSDFTLHNGTTFTNTIDYLTITETNILLDTNLTTNYLTINNDLLVKNNTIFQNNSTFGNDDTSIITFNSKLSNFTLHNGALFTNTSGQLTITEINTLLDTNLTTNYLTINNDLLVNEDVEFKKNLIIGTDNSNTITFNSKLNDFTLHNGTIFTNTVNNLTINETNILLDTNLTTNYLTINNDLLVKNNTIFQNNSTFGTNDTSIITFNSKLSNFKLHNGTLFTNTSGLLTITETNILLDTNLTTNYLTINNDLLVNEDVEFKKNLIIGTDNSNTITFNSKLNDFTLQNGAQFTNILDNLTITETNILLDTNLTTNYLTINSDLLVKNNTIFQNNSTFGTDDTSIITFNSKLSDFTLHNGTTFTNTIDYLTITETNILLDTNLTTNYLTIDNDLLVKNNTIFQNNSTFGTDDTSIITFNSKLSDFTLHNGTVFTNTIDYLTITETNILLDTNLTTNYLTINNDLLVKDDVQFNKNMIIGTNDTNIITFNSKLSDFTLHNGTTFTNTFGQLTITETNILLDTNLTTNNLTTNYLTINNDLLVKENVEFKKNLIIGTNDTNTITFNSTLSDFILHNGSTFTNITGLLTIKETNTLLDTNLTTNYLTINNDLLVKEDVEFKKNMIIGTDNTNTITFNSKLSDFTLHNGATFTNTPGKLTITETNMLLDTNLTTKNIIVNNSASFFGNISFGKINTSSIITFNSKIYDFTMHNNASFINSPDLLTIKENNILLDTNLSTNDLIIKEKLLVKNTTTFQNNLLFENNAKISDFTMLNNTQFKDTPNNLIIKQLLTTFDGNILVNNATIQDDFIVQKNSLFYGNISIGTNYNNLITFNSKLSNFTMNYNSTFVDTNQLLTVTQNNIYLKTNLNTDNLYINNNLNVLGNTILFGNTNIFGNITLGSNNNITTFKSKLSDFTMHKNAHFKDTIDSLQIKKNNIYIQANTILLKTTINDTFITNNNTYLNKNVSIGSNLNTQLTINSKLDNFTMNNNTTFIDQPEQLIITQNNIHLNSNIYSNSLVVLNNLNINGNCLINNDSIIGTSLKNNLIIKSKLHDFTMKDNAQFINNNNNLTIKNNNILLDSNTTTNNMFINNNLIINNNTILGSNHNNITTILSKLSDFTMTNGATFQNTPDNLTISNNNIYINSNLTNTNNLTVNNNLNVIENLNLFNNLIFYNNNTIHNAILQDFSTINQTKFINKENELIITQKNIHLNTNLSTNSVIVYNNTSLKQNVILGSTNNNFINILGKMSDFKMNNNTVFQNYDNNTLKITQNNIILNSNLNILNNTTIDENLYVQKNTYLNNNVYLGKNKNNTIHFNALLSDFYTINNTYFSNYNSNTLQITQDNIILNSNIDIKNNTTLNKNLTVLGNSHFKNDIIIGSNNLNTIHFKSQLSNFKMSQGASFNNNNNTLQITHQNILLNSNTVIYKNLDIKQNLDIQDNLRVFNNLHVSNTLNIHKDAYFYSNIHLTNNLSVSNIITNGNIDVSSNINTSSINVKQNINTQNINTQNLIVSNILQAYIGSPTNNFDDLIGNIDLNQNLLIPDAFQKIDYWINYYLIDTPPPPTLVLSNITQYYIDLNWNNPIQIYLAFVNQKVPYIDSIAVDYKLSQDTWEQSTTVVFNSSNITKLRIHPMNSTNYITDTTFNLFNILNQTFYDFRIYCINHNKNRPTKYLYFNNIKTNNISTPSQVNNFVVNNNINKPISSFDLTWEKPTLTNILDNVDNNINIKQYNINVIPVETKKYNSTLVYSNINITINSNSIFNNPITNHIIQNLYPGHTYALQIKSKNHILSDFSDYSYPPIIKNTHYPISPNFINNNNININNSTNYYFNNQTSQSFAYDLNNNIVNNLYDYDLLDDSFQTDIIDDIRINENISSTETTSSTISMNLNNSFYNINLDGFSHTNDSNNYFDDLNIKLYNQKDYYSDIYNSGFYKTLDFNVLFNSNKLFTPSNKKNTLSFNQILNYNSNIYNTKSHSFYVDKVNQPIISNLNINSVYNHNIDYISGVPVITDIKFNVNFITHNLTNNFYRYDKKLFDLTLSDPSYKTYQNININHDYIVNNSNYYNINNTLHNNGKFISPNTSSLLFKNFIITLNNNNNQGYTENLNITTNIYNLKYIKQNTFQLNNNIRLDYESLNSKNILNNSNSNHGLFVNSGLNKDFPLFPNNSANQIHNDNLNIFNNTLIPNSNISIKYNNFISYNNQNITINSNRNTLFIHDFYNNYNSTLNNILNINNVTYNYNIPLQFTNILSDISQINHNNINHYADLLPNLDYYNISNTESNTTIHYIYYVKFNNNKFEFYSDSNYATLVEFTTLNFISNLTYRFYQTHHSNKDYLLSFSTSNETLTLYPNLKYNSVPAFYNSYVDITVQDGFTDVYVYYDLETDFSSGSNYNPIKTKLLSSTNYNINISINSNIYTKNIHINNNIFSLQYNNIFIEQLQNIYSNNYNTILDVIDIQDKLVTNIQEFSSEYNHNKSLTTNYSLQLLNGYFVTNNYSNSYNSYNNYYLSNLYPDYSTISDDFRYSTFKYTSFDLSSNRLTLEIIDTNIDLLDTSDIKLYIKIYDDNNYETSWFNCSKFINMIGLSKFSKDNAGCLSKLNPVSEPTKRYIYLPRYSTGNILVRIGLKMDSPYYFKYIKLTQGFI